ncbi:MAG: hypothetical protein IJS80_05915 [Lachnospiraceae bacterium]|nr:hypothetical protein [Lachnospiraceae bacterium]
MDIKTRYYKFPVGSVVLRRTGDKLEKKGKKGIWEDASDQLWRFYSGDDDLIEISPEEAG